MALTHLEVTHRGPYIDGQSFGSVGAYERTDGIAHYAVDPDHPANAGLTDLKRAPRNALGQVCFDGDFTLLRPVSTKKSNNSLLVEVPNRGNRVAQRSFNRAPFELMPTNYIDPGDGFLMRHGWTVAFVGWQWDMPECVERLGLRAPMVEPSKREPDTQMMLRVQPDDAIERFSLTDHHVGMIGNHATIPPARADDPHARLLVRETPYGDATELARSSWRFISEEGNTPTHVALDGGFTPGHIYDLLYTPLECPVAGAGLLAVRDFGAFMRYDEASPLHGQVDSVIAQGISQCGRFLRTLLHLGLNETEQGQMAFDGVLAHIAGGRRGEFNQRYGQPSVQPTPAFGHLFPFADAPQTDPQTQHTAGLLDRLRARNTMPKVIYTDTSSEYWRGDAGLTHLDLASGTDVEPPDDVRRYLFASTQHSPGTLPFNDKSMFDTYGSSNFNIVDYRPLYRATLHNLRSWIREDIAPPASCFPRLADNTAAKREAVINTLTANSVLGLAAAQLPEPARLPGLIPLDLGARANEGIGEFPAKTTGTQYATVVSAVDEAGNETGGVRMPDVSVPVAAHTGFNARHASTGGDGQLLEYVGSTWVLRDVAERYTSRAQYLTQIRTAAEALVGQRLLLEEDIDVCISIAGERYDAAIEAAARPANA
jgi:hypothetical protein